MVCVGNDDDLRSVVLGDGGALAAMKKGSILVDHTTASAGVARELHAIAKEKGIGLIDAPVSGGEAGAVNGQLTVMCGGEGDAFAAVQPVGMAFSRAFTLLGDSGAGQLAKMVNQIAIAGLVQGLSEAVAFGQHDAACLDEQGSLSGWSAHDRSPAGAAALHKINSLPIGAAHQSCKNVQHGPGGASSFLR